MFSRKGDTGRADWPDEPAHREAAIDGVKMVRAAVQKSVESALSTAQAALPGGFLVALSSGAAALAPGFATGLIIALTRALLDAEGGISEIRRVLETLRRGPFRRALLQLGDAGAVAAHTPQDPELLRSRLTAALESLDEAQSVAKPFEMPSILVLKIAVASELRSPPLCERYADTLEHYCSLAVAWLDTETTDNQAKLHEHLARSESCPPAHYQGAIAVGGGLVSWDRTGAEFERRVYALKAQRRVEYAAALETLRGDLAVVRNTVQVLTHRAGA